MLPLLCGAARSEEPVYDIDIPSMNAAEALNRFAEQTGAIMLFSYDLASAQRTNAVRGRYTLLEGLDLLLQGTGLSGGLSNKRVVNISPSGNAQRPGEETAMPKEKASFGKRITAFVTSMFSISAASGQDAAGVGAQPLEEIVVTAQKREERLIDVPISVSVLGAEELQRRGLVSREDYMRSVPNVLLRDEGVGLAEIVIRGAYGERFNTGPTVGLYFGDVPLTGYAVGGSTDIKLIDIERVEVLRGPQGSLYGSNALSGAVRYVPAAPDLQEFTGRIEVGYGRTRGNGGDQTAIEGVLNVPLVQDELALRAVVFQHENEGYVRNVAGSDSALQATAASVGATHLAISKDNVGSTEHSGGRLGALWRPIAGLSLGLTYLAQKDAQDDRLFELQQSGPYQRSDYQFGDTIGGNDDALRVDLDVVNLTAEYDLGWATLNSSTAWIEQRFIRKWDTGIFQGLPLKPIPQISTTNAEVFTQELRLVSAFQGPFQMVAGVYYEDSEQPTVQATYFGGDPAFNPFSSTRVLLYEIALDRLVKQKAVFGEFSYDVTDQIELTVGGRAFDYDSRFWTTTFNSIVLPESASDEEAGESDQTFKAGIEYKPSSESLVYATWSQGFRLGRPLATELIRNTCDRDRDGLLDGTNVSSSLDQISSDRLDSYELGAKLSFLDGRATVSTAVYHNEWRDIPVAFSPPGCITSTTINAGSARARGFESEGELHLTHALRVNFGIGYVDSELSATTSAGRDGDRMNFTPEVNGSLGLQYDTFIGGRRTFVRGDYSYFGSYYTQTGKRGIRADSYDLVNLRIGMAFTKGAELQLHIDNVLDSDALTSVLGPSGFPPGYGVRLRPRTIGGRLSYRF